MSRLDVTYEVLKCHVASLKLLTKTKVSSRGLGGFVGLAVRCWAGRNVWACSEDFVYSLDVPSA